MNKEAAQIYLRSLGEELQQRQLTGEILVNDEVVVLLDIGRPEDQVEVDAYMAYLKGEGPEIKRQTGIAAYFKSDGAFLREVAGDIAICEGLSNEWLEDALQALFFSSLSAERWLEYPGLRVYVAPMEYMLVMKIAVAQSQEGNEDILLMAQKLGIKNAQELLTVITMYIPEQLLTATMRMITEQTFR
ncbi:MAG: hypothetical protein ABI406_09990 [Ktedonobacteraceae bacterium]